MQFSYSYPVATVGQIGGWDVGAVDSLVWPLTSQTTVFHVSGTNDGTYTLRIAGEEGTFDSSFVASSNTTAQIIDGIIGAVTGNNDLNNIVSATSDSVATGTLAFIHEGYSYTVSYPSNPSTSLSTDSSSDASPARVPLGIGVVDNGSGGARVPASGDSALDILGISVRNADQVLTLDYQQPDPGLAAPASVSAMRQGSCWIECETTASVNDPVFVRIVATGDEQAGAVRIDADGSDAVQIPGRFRTSCSAGGLARIEVNLPG